MLMAKSKSLVIAATRTNYKPIYTANQSDFPIFKKIFAGLNCKSVTVFTVYFSYVSFEHSVYGIWKNLYFCQHRIQI